MTTDEETMKISKNYTSTVRGGCEVSMMAIHDKWSNNWKVSIFKNTYNQIWQLLEEE